MVPVPAQPKIYHIVHVDRMPSIIADGYLWADAIIRDRAHTGTTIGMTTIKQRRLQLPITSHPGLHVGDCVPFYFCPRSVMLYLLYRGNYEELTYRDGQEPIIHLEADLIATITWAQQQRKKWAFTLSNAGAYYFEDRCDLAQLSEINWAAVQATKWAGLGVSDSVKEGKQAEFLLQERFPWQLVERIGVISRAIAQQVMHHLHHVVHRPKVEIKRDWYY